MQIAAHVPERDLPNWDIPQANPYRKSVRYGEDDFVPADKAQTKKYSSLTVMVIAFVIAGAAAGVIGFVASSGALSTSGEPVQEPTVAPTKAPTDRPNTASPTVYPTLFPTAPTTLSPTGSPTTSSPTTSPTKAPTHSPTTPDPTTSPSPAPSKSPSKSPTRMPTRSPVPCPDDYLDCDNDENTGDFGCEIDSSEDVENCGWCTNNCNNYQHVNSASCESGQCNIIECDNGHTDKDGDPLTGCECTITDPTDLPDNNFEDKNCDGIVGNKAKGIFVDTGGNNGNSGEFGSPVASIQVGIDKANSQSGKEHVYVATGTYWTSSTITLASGISIFGGYQPGTWVRGDNQDSVISKSGSYSSGRVVGVQGNGISSVTYIDRMKIQTANAGGTGVSNYGLHCISCSGLRLRHIEVVAGNASPGSNGGSGGNGGSGSNGHNGQNGDGDNNSGGGGGAPGESPCGRHGGAGGSGAYGYNSGYSGSSGNWGTSGGGGGGRSHCDGKDASNGHTGSAGGNGVNGSGGNKPSVSNHYFSTEGGSGGSGGSHGDGGGGGGGGGGQGVAGGWNFCCCIKGKGNGGGGGGGAGCGASGGSGASGGGSSVGVFFSSSPALQLRDSEIHAGNGGNGGNGGAAGCGGTGGSGGSGASRDTGEVGRGGNGGSGGRGGRGGHGGGGSGGHSVAQVVAGGSISTNGNSLYHGVAGAAGSGGSRYCSIIGTSYGDPGASGDAKNFMNL